MDKKHNRLIQLLQKNWSNMLILGLGITLLLVPESKIIANQVLIKTGIFNPKVEMIEASEGLSNIDKLNFPLTNQKGKIIELNELKGKVIFINFWATWCPPCLAEMPSIQKLAQTFKNDKNIVFIMVEVESNENKAPIIFQKRKIDLPIYYPKSNIPQ